MTWRHVLTGIALASLAIVGLAALGYWLQRSIERTTAKEFPAPGRLVIVGDHQLHINCKGSGRPPVVFEAGLSGWSQDWSYVQPALSKVTTACSYDRAGLGWSEAPSTPRTGRYAVGDLRAALNEVGVGCPRILAGHSLGGLLVQLYARDHPTEVAGLILIDSLQRGQFEIMPTAMYNRYVSNMRMLTTLAAIGAPFGLMRAARLPGSIILDRLPSSERHAARALAFNAKTYRALRDETRSLEDVIRYVRNQPALPQVPTVVLSTNAVRDFPPGWNSIDMQRYWISAQEMLVLETSAEHVVVANAGHFIQIERPDLVIEAIGNAVARSRAADITTLDDGCDKQS
jgi:pimeloyl-ACP methyl ester carboxylesterase